MGCGKSTPVPQESQVPSERNFRRRVTIQLESFAQRHSPTRGRSSAASDRQQAPASAPPTSQGPVAPARQGQASSAGTATRQQQQQASPRPANVIGAGQASSPGTATGQHQQRASPRPGNVAGAASRAPARDVVSTSTQTTPRGQLSVGLHSHSQTLLSSSPLAAPAPQQEGPSSNPSTQDPLARQEGRADSSSSNSSTRGRRATSASLASCFSAPTNSAPSSINTSPRARVPSSTSTSINTSQRSVGLANDCSSISSTSLRSILRGNSTSISPSPKGEDAGSISSISTPRCEDTRGYISSTPYFSAPRQRRFPSDNFSSSPLPEVHRSQQTAMNSSPINPLAVRPAQSLISDRPRTEQEAVQARSYGSSVRRRWARWPRPALSAGPPTAQG